jgi:hypothetical protein
VVREDGVVFPDSINGEPTFIPRFNPEADPEGVASRIPYMDHFYDNSLQTGLMRDLAVDFELLGEHLVLLGNQVCSTSGFKLEVDKFNLNSSGCREKQACRPVSRNSSAKFA